MHDASPIPIERLLEHRAWVRSLARRIVGDDARADDLEQQTWLAAMERPPRGATPRAWLGTVVRNLASKMRRSEVRLHRREAHSARSERLPSTSEVVAEAEAHRLVVEAVLAIDAPHRDAVLLRHFEGLSPLEVAERLGIPLETARARVRRGIEKVRAHLDRQQGGDDARWRLALAPLVATASTSPALSAGAALGVTLMNTKLLVAAGVLGIALLVGSVLWNSSDAPTPTVTAHSSAELTSSPELAGSAAEGPSIAPSNEPSDAHPHMDTEAPRCVLRVVTTTTEGDRPVANAWVRVAGDETLVTKLRTDASGEAMLGAAALGTPTTLWIESEDGRMARERQTLEAGTHTVRLPAVDPMPVTFVEITDGQQRSLSTDEVRRRYADSDTPWTAQWIAGDAVEPQGPADMMRVVLGAPAGWRHDTQIRVGSAGAYLAARPTAGRWWLLHAAPGRLPDLLGPYELGAAGPTVQIAFLSPLPSKAVEIVDAETGVSLPDVVATAYVQLGKGPAFVPSQQLAGDAAGKVQLPQGPRFGGGDVLWWIETPTHAGVWPTPLGNPLVDGQVAIWRRCTVQGRAWLASGEAAVGHRVLFTPRGRLYEATVGADGTYRLDDLPIVHGPTHAESIGLVEDLGALALQSTKAALQPGATIDVDVGAPRSSAAFASVRGRVTAAGQPLAGLIITLTRKGMATSRWLRRRRVASTSSTVSSPGRTRSTCCSVTTERGQPSSTWSPSSPWT